MRNKSKIGGAAAFIFVLILLCFATISRAQASLGTPIQDTWMNPHDFTNEFYAAQGVTGRSIIGRRNGSDYLSVFGYSSNPNHRDVRVRATFPGRSLDGTTIYFWYPLGELTNSGFTNDKNGIAARNLANASPIYVFPMRSSEPVGPTSFSIYDVRQAALISAGSAGFPLKPDVESVGTRIVVYVNYTEKAFTGDSREMMEYMMKKNGHAADSTPAIMDMNDMNMLMKEGLIAMEAASTSDRSTIPVFALAPIIADPTNGAIALDAFLILSTVDSQPLPSEEIFATQFKCLQQIGTWCKE